MTETSSAKRQKHHNAIDLFATESQRTPGTKPSLFLDLTRDSSDEEDPFTFASSSSMAGNVPPTPGCSNPVIRPPIPTSLPSFDDFLKEQEEMKEERRRKEQEETRRRALEAAQAEEKRRLLQGNIITIAQDMFKDISVAFLEKLMRDIRPKVSSDDELADACIQTISNMKGEYPRREKRKRPIDDNGAERYGQGSHEDEENASSSEDEPDVSGPSSQSKAQAQTQTNRNYMDCSIRMMGYYETCCLHQLYQDFPKISSGTIRACMRKHGNHYAPTFEFINNLWGDTEAARMQGNQNSTDIKLVEVKTPRKEKHSQWKQRMDPEFQTELEWVKAKIAKEMAELEAIEEEARNNQYYKDLNELIECGCCFDDIPPNRVAQCEDGHLFCLSCSKQAAEVEIGYKRTVLKCMSAGCTSAFTDSEAVKFLPGPVFKGLLRARQQQELKMAGLDSLVECPFCPYAAVMENEQDKEFRCQAKRCRKVSCRQCKQLTHIPLSCAEFRKEQEKNSVLTAQHRVEEEMSQALIRECPKCKARFFKTEGMFRCNKMTCPECHTKMCYVCKKQIKDYSHFDQTPANSPARNKNLCRLWENTIERNESEVKAAAQRTIQELKAQEPDVVAQVRVDIPSSSSSLSSHLAAQIRRTVQQFLNE
ncbi:hypothetical protein BGX28_006736 [Mortierella sp. GBA30]|nr:hypothetical protein BGX28_006736 [Mortierella sp. GBA30]